MPYEEYEDKIILEKQILETRKNKVSPYCDFVHYESSVTPGLSLAARIIKPARPSYILVGTHGWHMSIPEHTVMEEPDPNNHYLRVQVDMRGRAHSTGNPDCNGLELFDVIDAVNYVRRHYREWIIDPAIVYFEAGSGGGGNALAIVGKFPDFFAAGTALCGISDYALWYENDHIGEFRDEMDVWVGCSPADHPMAYQARSGLRLLPNLQTPLYLAHGETDERVPVEHSRMYVATAVKLNKKKLIQYDELPGVGTQSHWGNATASDMDRVNTNSERNRQMHRKPVTLPRSGSLVIAGYLVTKYFSIHLDSMDKVALLEYDLDQQTFRLTCEVKCDYDVRLLGS